MKQGDIVELQQLKKEHITINVRGITSLLMEKMDMEVVEKYTRLKENKVKFENTKMEEEVLNTKIHYTSDGNIGFPSVGFWKGMVEVAPYIEGLDKKRIKGSIRMVESIIPINYKKQGVNITWGKTSGIGRAPRKIMRPEFFDWNCKLEINYNRALLSPEHIYNLVNLAGFQMGLGGWRPEHNGTYGQYEVAVKVK